jgi:anti-sigma-K factor RskA
MTDSALTMSCAEIEELSGLYVLDALEPAERRDVESHLATCPQAHAEYAEVGGVVPALASLATPVDAPPQLKARVIAAVQREAASVSSHAAKPEVKPWTLAVGAPSPAARRSLVPAWASWASALAAVLILAVVGVWALGLQGQAQRADARAAALADAIEAFSAPDSETAVLRGSGAQSDASGFAALTADGKSYLVMIGLSPLPADQTYQAWYIADGAPASAGLMTVDEDGYAVIVDPQPLAGTRVVAVTVEPRGGSEQPTTEPFVAGELRDPA